VSVALHTDLSDLCLNLQPGARLVVSHGSDGFTTVRVVPPDCSPDDPHGKSRNFPTSRNLETVLDAIGQPGIPLHEIAGISIERMARKIVESVPEALG
jgi:hypothetical protein